MRLLDSRRISIFLLLTYCMAWGGAFAVTRNGEALPDTVLPTTHPTGLLEIVFLLAPSVAHLVTRAVTGEGWSGMGLRLSFGRSRLYWLAAWTGPAILTILGGMLFFAVFPQFFDASLDAYQGQLAQAAQMTGQPMPFGPWVFVVVGVLVAVLLSPIVSFPFSFGEEFGWRGYLLPKLMPLGMRNAILGAALLQGLWYAPLVYIGVIYGRDYPGAPWFGMLAMVWFTLLCGVPLGWMTVRCGTIWPAVIAHAALNGIAASTALCVMGAPDSLLGPFPTGLVASVPFLITAVFLLWRLPEAAPVP